MAMELLRRLTQGFRAAKPDPGPQWRTPTVLDRGSLGEACLALDGQGHGTALWENAGSLWTMPIGPHSAPALVRRPLGEGTSPRIELNPDGRGIALWLAEAAGERQVLGRILGGVESSTQVVFRTVGVVKHLQGAVDRRGNALVVWLLEVDGRTEVMAQAFDTRGSAWEQAPTTLGSSSAPAVAPRMAVNHREHAMVLWEVEDGRSEGLVASHYWPSDGIWSDRPVPVVAQATHHHQVVMDDLGNALAVWVHAPYGQRSRLEASFYDGTRSEWGKPETLCSAQSFSALRLAMSGDGEALAAWCQGEGHGPARLFTRAFRKGGWDAGSECLELGHGPVQDLALALGAEGQAGLLATHRGPQGDWVSARLRQREWSEPFQLLPASRLLCSAPRLCLCAHGASALWIQGEGREHSLILAEAF